MLAALGFLVTVTYWPGLAGAAEASRWATLYVALPTVLVFLPVRLTPHHWIGGALVLLAALSLAWTPVGYDGIDAVAHLGVIAGAFLVGHSTEDMRPTYSWMGIGLWVSTAAAIAQWVGWMALAVPGHAAEGLFVNPSVYASLAVAVLVGLMADRTWWIAAGVAPGLFLTLNRGAFLAAAVCAALAVLRGKWRWIGLVGAAGLIVIALLVKPDLVSSGQARIDLWHDTLSGATFVGHGIGSFYSALPQFNAWSGGVTLQAGHAHNDLIEILFELGPIGVALVSACVGLALALAAPRDRLVLVALVVTSMLWFTLSCPATAFMFGAVAGHAARGWSGLRRHEPDRGYPVYARGQ